MKKSEFGKGLAYCLGLFLAHAERARHEYTYEGKLDDGVEMWFSAASDHLYDLTIPKHTYPKLRVRLAEFREKVLHWGHGYSEPHPTKADLEWAIGEAKVLLLLIDRSHGIRAIEASWK